MRPFVQMLTAPIVGNAHDDADLWSELHTVARSRGNTQSIRAQAIRHMDKLTGEPSSDVHPLTTAGDAALIAEYERELIEMVGEDAIMTDPTHTSRGMPVRTSPTSIRRKVAHPQLDPTLKVGERVKVEFVVREVSETEYLLETYEPQGALPVHVTIPRAQVRLNPKH